MPKHRPTHGKKGPTSYLAELHRSSTSTTMFVACRLAVRFMVPPGSKLATKLPTIAALCHEFGMSRATAYRWRGAMRDTLGLPDEGRGGNKRPPRVANTPKLEVADAT